MSSILPSLPDPDPDDDCEECPRECDELRECEERAAWYWRTCLTGWPYADED